MKKVLCTAEKSSVIWAKPHSRSSAQQFGRTERSVGHYIIDNSRFKQGNLGLKSLVYDQEHFQMEQERVIMAHTRLHTYVSISKQNFIFFPYLN